jgi:hypothetical protein
MQPGETISPGGAKPAPTKIQAPTEPKTSAIKAAPAHEGAVSWTASEYISHDKPSGWYVSVGLGAAVLAIAIYLLTHDALSAGVVVVVGIIFGILAARQPRTLPYAVDHAGITIGQKFYSYGDFKSFAIVDEDAIYSIMLLPMKRFMPGVSLYYPPDQEDEILDMISTYLPHEPRQADVVDRLARKLRF